MNGFELSALNSFFEVKMLCNEAKDTIENFFEGDVKDDCFYDPSYLWIKNNMYRMNEEVNIKTAICRRGMESFE